MNAVKSIVVGVLCLSAGMVGAVPLYQCPLTVNGYAEGKAALTDFPVLVRISTAIDQFNYGDCAAGGADISFTSEDGETVYPHEVDTWNPDGESLVWVKLPSMAHGTKFLFRWSDPNPLVNDTTAVWPDYVGVWHFNSYGENGTPDSTSHGFTATNLSSWAWSSDTNPKNGSGALVGSFRAPDYEPTCNVGGTFSVSGWVYGPTYPTEGQWIGFASKNVGTGGDKRSGFLIEVEGKATSIIWVAGDNQKSGYVQPSCKDVTKYWQYFTMTCNGSKAICYLDGAKVGEFSKTIGGCSSPFTMGGKNFRVDEYRVRQATSSADWVKAEYEVATKADYLAAGTTEIQSLGAVVVSSDGPRYGKVSPTYGQIAEPVAGATYDFSCTVATQTLNEAKTTRAVCTGWELRKLSNGELIKSSLSEGESQFSCSHQYVQGEGVELKWHWQIQHKVTAAAGTGGTVSPTEQWVDAGTMCAPIMATANDGCGFYKWTGDVPADATGANPLAVPVVAPQSVTASFGKNIYVALNGSDDAAGTEAAPLAGIARAIERASAGDIIVLGEGTFSLPTTNFMQNSTGWKLRGAGMDKTFIAGGSRIWAGFKVSHDDAEFSDFTYKGHTWANDNNRGRECSAFIMSKGYLHDVRVTDVNQSASGQFTGIALRISGGHVKNCVIDGNTSTRTDMYTLGAICQTGGLIEHCVISNNTTRESTVCLSGGTNAFCVICNNTQNAPSDNTYSDGGGVCVAGSGVLLNATVYGNKCAAGINTTSHSGAGVYHKGGKVIDCIVWGNSLARMIPAQTYGPDFYTANAANVTGLCSPVACGTDPVAAYPEFADAAHADFSLRASSPCIRPDGRTLGAIPFDRAVPSMGMTVWPTETYFDSNVTFTATVRNATAPVYEWVVTPDGEEDPVLTQTGASFSEKLDPGWYGVKLTVTDGGKVVGVDERPHSVHIGAYTNYLTKADNIAEALANAIGGQTFILAPDTYTVSDIVWVLKDVTVLGDSQTNTVIRRNGGNRVMAINHPNAHVSRLKITGGSLPDGSRKAFGSGVWIGTRGGTLDWCTIANNTVGGHYMRGGGVAITGSKGLVSHCIIKDNSIVWKGGGEYGGGAYVGAGVLDNCLITGCKGQYGGGVAVAGSGKVRNCTIVNNTATSTGGGLYWDNATSGSAEVRNCVIAENVASSLDGRGKQDWAPDTATEARYSTMENNIFSCAFCNSKSDFNVIGSDPQKLVDPFADSDYRMKLTSAAVDHGSDYDGISDTDLDGAVRVQGAAVDIGCYETDNSQFSCGAGVDVPKALSGETVNLLATVFGVAREDAAFAWEVMDRTGKTVFTGTGDPCPLSIEKAGYYDVRLTVTNLNTMDTAEDFQPQLVFVGAKTNYVTAVSGPGAVYPFDDPSCAATNLLEAVDAALAGATICLLPGEHKVNGTLTLDKEVTISGSGYTNCTIRTTKSGVRGVYINHDKAEITGVTITGARPDGDPVRNTFGFGVRIGVEGGKLTWSRVTGIGSDEQFAYGVGVGIEGTKARVSHCIIDNCVAMQKDGGAYGGGLAVKNGTVDNCLVISNKTYYGGGVALWGNAKLLNCTVAYNTAWTQSGGIYVKEGSGQTVKNCILYGNACANDTSTGKPEWHGSSSIYFNCAFPSGVTTTGVNPQTLGDDPFENAAGGDYRLKLSAAAVDAGTTYDGLAELDLAAGPRVIGDSVDMGAYEANTEDFGASFKMDKTEALLGVAFTATNKVTGSTNYDCDWTVYAPDGAAVKTFSGDSWTWTPETDGWYRVTMTVTDNEQEVDPIIEDSDKAFYVAPTRIDLAENASIHDALALALDGTKICLSAGEYVTTARVTVAKGVVIEGPGYKLCTVRAGTNWAGDRRVFYLNHPKVTLRGVTVTGGQMGTAQNGVGDTRNISGGGVCIAANGGTVEDCRITGNRSGTYYNCGGGVAILSASGVVRNCIIDHNNVICTSLKEYGGGVYMSSGVISNCVIHSNVALDGGGLYLDNAGTIANCTIVSNRATSTVGGVFMTEWASYVKVRDSIIWGNVDSGNAQNDTTRPEYSVGFAMGANLFNYCAFSEGTRLPYYSDDHGVVHYVGEGNFTCDPGFKRFDRLDFRIKMFSPCDRVMGDDGRYHGVSSTGSWLGALEPYPAGFLLLVK